MFKYSFISIKMSNVKSVMHFITYKYSTLLIIVMLKLIIIIKKLKPKCSLTCSVISFKRSFLVGIIFSRGEYKSLYFFWIAHLLTTKYIIPTCNWIYIYFLIIILLRIIIWKFHKMFFNPYNFTISTSSFKFVIAIFLRTSFYKLKYQLPFHLR